MKCVSLSLIVIALVLGGCGTSPSSDSSAAVSGQLNIPTWIDSPIEPNGLAASTCVRSSANFSVDRRMAITSAKAVLIEQLKSRTSSLITLQEEGSADEVSVSSEIGFKSVAETVSSQWVTGVRPTKFVDLELRGKPHTCALVVLPAAETKKLFRRILDSAGRDFTEKDEKFMFDQFVASSTKSELGE